jgi:hypothetical protein
MLAEGVSMQLTVRSDYDSFITSHDDNIEESLSVAPAGSIVAIAILGEDCLPQTRAYKTRGTICPALVAQRGI